MCLQTYDGDHTIPRVLACGHSACDVCLVQLPQPYPHTIRCPACTQLVKYPHPQGPSALPKNIDLLRFSLTLNTNPDNSPKPNRQTTNLPHFIPHLWPDEFYSNWKDWVLLHNSFLVESKPQEEEEEEVGGLCSVINGRITSSSSVSRCCIKEGQNVRLFRVTPCLPLNDSVFSFSYVAQVMEALWGMEDQERAELGLILTACSTQRRMCKAYGLWYNSDDRCLFLVFQRYIGSAFLEKLSQLRNGISGRKDNDFLDPAVSCFAIMGMEICEALIGLHSEGILTGCLGLSSLNFDGFGHVYIDMNDSLATGRKIRKSIRQLICGRQRIGDEEMGMIYFSLLGNKAFVSPELFFEFLSIEGVALKPDSLRYAVGYNSDVWALACILLQLLTGEQFSQEMIKDIHELPSQRSEENGIDFLGFFKGWAERVRSLLETKLAMGFVPLQQILCKCLSIDPGSRPLITDVWKCVRELIIKPQFDIMVSLEGAVKVEKKCCLVLGKLCKLLWETDKGSQTQKGDDSGGAIVDQAGEVKVEKDLVDGFPDGTVKFITLQGHLDCITCLAIGGGFLFSSSFDKTISVWSLQDFTHVHSFRGHEYKVMAVVFVDEEQPLCISGDSGGGIFVWSISTPFSQEPFKKWYEQKDWRFSGVHALAVAGTQYLYTGSGDKSIKAWSLQDCTLSCTMSGHRSVVSSLALCDGVLYSGSWDGTIRLWSLNDHSPLTVLGEDTPGNVTSVLSLSADQRMLVAAYENGSIKIWKNDVFKRSLQVQDGSIFALDLEGKWLFSGGWNRTINVQELLGDELQVDARPVGSIACDSVVTALLNWQGKLFVGYADKLIKVYYYGS